MSERLGHYLPTHRLTHSPSLDTWWDPGWGRKALAEGYLSPTRFGP
jgi:hypothetical protein